ncbi:hypothetical protein ABZ565_10485 [Streptomyces sp. NPDC016469]|uniref:hypothetical protein n=1 Tax=Streptomyces sp. NPDC016469 TaxID=3157191 RepID=UPI0033DC6C4C
MPLVVLVEVGLVRGGVLGVGEAVVVGLAVEGVLGGVVLVEVVLAGRAYRASRRAGADGQEAVERALRTVLPGPLAKVVGMEFGLFRALWRWVRRMPDVPDGCSVLAYGAEIRPIMWVMVFLAPLEIALAEFLVPWAPVRIALLVLSAYGVLWLVGFVAALSVRPHVVGGGRLVLRFAHFVQVAVPLDLIESVRTSRHSGYRRAVQISDGVLAMPVGDSTTLSVTLREPYAVAPKPGQPPQDVREVRFAVDDPREAVRVLTASRADTP